MKKNMMYMLAGIGAAVVFSQVKNGNVKKLYNKISKKVDHEIEDMM